MEKLEETCSFSNSEANNVAQESNWGISKTRYSRGKENSRDKSNLNKDYLSLLQ